LSPSPAMQTRQCSVVVQDHPRRVMIQYLDQQIYEGGLEYITLLHSAANKTCSLCWYWESL